MRFLRRNHAFLLGALVACGSPSPAPPPPTAASEQTPGAPWIAHAENDLMRFWMHPDAQGEPRGKFPSVRCNDGKKLDRRNPCPEIAHDEWLMMDLDYVVSMSRQTYGYGVAFHLTGDPRYLVLAKAGVDYLRTHALDPAGGAFAVHNGTTDAWEPGPKERNPQELAYAALGMTFYWYLTRDASVLKDVLALKEHIFKTRFDPRENLFVWKEEGKGANDKRLVAQLDQLNAYLLLLAPTVGFKDELRRIVGILRDTFYSAEENLFFPRDDRSTATSEADFGHTIKSFWMTRFVGQELGDATLVSFAEERGMAVLKRAFLPTTGSWARAVKKGGAIDDRKEWWVHDELDQFAATMTLTKYKPEAERYLAKTYPWFLEHFIDRRYGESWSFVEPDGRASATMPKAWPWKSAYHNLEHALVAYIAAQASHGLPATLYFAFPTAPPAATLRPYFFRGHLRRLEARTVARPAAGTSNEMPSVVVQRAEFDRIE